MARVLVLVTFAAVLGQLAAAPVPKGGPKPPWKFPTQVGTKWVYTESGDRDAEVTETVTKAEKQDGARVLVIRYESEWTKGGAKWGEIDYTKWWLDDEGLFEASGKPYAKPTYLLLMLPHNVGDVRERKHPDLQFSKTVSRALAEEKLKVPAGTFDCVRIETKLYEGEQIAFVRTDWYASGVGLVKSTGFPHEKRVWVLKEFKLGADPAPAPQPKAAP
jgi:hypothetical protein